MPPRMGTLLTSLTTLALLLAACFSPSDPEDMLLAPQDFPGRELEAERTSSVELGGGERSKYLVALLWSPQDSSSNLPDVPSGQDPNEVTLSPLCVIHGGELLTVP